MNAVAATAVTDWFRVNSREFSGQLLFDEPLGKHTYYRIGGPAELLAVPRTREDLSWLAEGIRATGIPYFVLGAGSNLLASDQGFAGLVIKMGRLNLELSVLETRESKARIRTGCSVAISSLLRRAVQEGWAGLEFLTGVPGSVGGAVFMNAGTHLGEAKDRLRKVEIVPLAGGAPTGLPVVFEGSQLRYEYRKNLFLPGGCVVWAAEWEVELAEPAKVKAMIDETLARRKASQPVDFPSCGSVFKNPRESGMRAWEVIDKLGLRGHRIGDAKFSEKHPNFIINLGAAKAADVHGLIRLAKGRAAGELGVRLEEEVIYLGFTGRDSESTEGREN